MLGAANFQYLYADYKITIRDFNTKQIMSGVTVHFMPLESRAKDSVKLRISNNKGEVVNPLKVPTIMVLHFVGYHRKADTLWNKEDKTIFMAQSSVNVDEIVVTGQFTPRSAQKSVYDIKTISEAKIFEQGSSNLRDLLMTEPSMKISNDGILGAQLSINGVSGSNVKVLVDGVPIIGRLDNFIDLSQINLNNVQRVEIVEGPMSSIYGSDALGGVINLITRDPNCERLEFEANSYSESVGAYNLDGAVRYSFEDFNFLLNGGRNLFQGYDPVDTSRNKQWNPKEQYFADFQALYSLDNHKIRYSSSYFHEYILNRGALRYPYYETAFDDKYNTQRWTNSLFFNGKLGEHSFYDVTSAVAYYQRRKNSFFKDMLTLNEIPLEDVEAQDTTEFYTYMLRGTYSDDDFIDYVKYQVGVDLNYDIARGEKIKDGEKNISDVAAFLSLQFIPHESVIFQPSLRVIKNSEYEAPLVPALNFKYEINSNLVLRASYAKGFRAPSLKELYLIFVDVNHNIHGNDQLKAETSDNYNLSIQFHSNDDKYYFKLEPKFFYNRIYNMINLAFISGTQYKNVNIGEYETIGGNFTLQYIRKNIFFNTTFAYIGRSNSDLADYNLRKFNFSPELSINTDFLIDAIDSKLNIFYKYTGETPNFTLLNDQPVEYIVHDYHMMDISLSKKMFDMFTLVAGVKNIFDVDNLQSTMNVSTGAHSGGESPVAWGRTLFLKINFKVNQ